MTNSWKEHYVVKSKRITRNIVILIYSWKEHYVVKSKLSYFSNHPRDNSWKEHYVVKSKPHGTHDIVDFILGKNIML